jgi:archaellum biogenesis ATPase FlaH
MWIWLIGIHVVELITVGIFLLIRRNNALEKAVTQQQQYLDAISIVIQNSQEKLVELDTLGAFQTDDEVGTFFKNLKEIQDVLNEFNTRK